MTPALAPTRTALLAGLAAATFSLAACGGGGRETIELVDAVDARTRLDFGACAVALPDPRAVCGTLTVPENRERLASRLIRVPFALLPATAASPGKEPVAVLGGGPGPSTLASLARLPAELLAQHPLRQSRDLIVMDLRGSALTGPQSLDCPELVPDYAAGERFTSVAAVLDAASACKARLERDGADLSGYDSRSAARDMEELRLLLGRQRGFSQWNVVGTSYGTRWALHHLRESGPAGIRSLVLDGPLPPQVGTIRETGVLDALSEVAAACAGQAHCAGAFPSLVPRFAVAVEQLESRPVALPDGSALSGHRLLRLLSVALNAGASPAVPLFMDRIARGDLAGANELLPLAGVLELSPNTEGVFYSVACRDDGVRDTDSDALPPQGAGWPEAVRRLAARHATAPAAQVCERWTVGQTLPAAMRQPVKSTVPALITVGRFDAATPLTNAALLQRDLSRSHLVIFPGAGHGLLESDPCMLQLAAGFIERPHAAPDTACVPPAQGLDFLVP